MAEYIDRETAIEAIISEPTDAHYPSWYTERIKQIPAADVAQVVHGYNTGRCRIFNCSECGYGVDDIFQEDEHNYSVEEFNYCPNCGARMDLEMMHRG